MKVLTLRLPVELYDDLKEVARVDGKSASDEVREALEAHIARRRADPEFRHRLAERIERDSAVLKRLAQ